MLKLIINIVIWSFVLYFVLSFFVPQNVLDDRINEIAIPIFHKLGMQDIKHFKDVFNGFDNFDFSEFVNNISKKFSEVMAKVKDAISGGVKIEDVTDTLKEKATGQQ
ncbi:hypothetical protein Cyrtocomes_00164 [Candidatus Cyrtobacter comes]|uniref:Uncharacterized protein n=1 Tax=Candidatus Cyrtobacter comes TaxID=675776 RepID=A0ABU5L6Q9_9RICK|nr:hypothetical protein [Candidatus Cyrtobacter comes]MDZ5761806.1 hypothetical protein [Candidatus Cyrtobacter comes]